jgi:alpha-tubulin suppressor-like RCC1 family protein
MMPVFGLGGGGRPRARVSSVLRVAVAVACATATTIVACSEADEEAGCLADHHCKGERICDLATQTCFDPPSIGGAGPGGSASSVSSSKSTAETTTASTGGGGAGGATTGTGGTPYDFGDIAAGQHHACGVRPDGLVRCWGWGQNGQLGDGNLMNSNVPVVVGELSDVASIRAGSEHTCAALVSGKVKCFGSNQSGQLGDGTTMPHATPVEVTSLDGVVAVMAGWSHTCALTMAGELHCWGNGFSGQLGVGDTMNSATPVKVMQGVVDAAAGYNHSCAVLSNGELHCWGYNGVAGELGTGAGAGTYPTPQLVSALKDVKRVVSGFQHTCALLGDGALWCWGLNNNGQLGDGTLTDRPNPVAVQGLPGKVASMALGYQHTCAVLGDGALWCWGQNQQGGVGKPFTTPPVPEPQPQAVAGLAKVLRVAGGTFHTCLLLEDKAARCMGGNAFGQLGNGTNDHSASPVEPMGF